MTTAEIEKLKASFLEFTPEELQHTSILSSFSYNRFAHVDRIDYHDRALVYKARKVYEYQLEKLCVERAQAVRDQKAKNLPPNDENKHRSAAFFDIYVKIGHVNLLGMDYPKAMSAYQHAYKNDPEKFRCNAEALFGLGLTYFHFRVYDAFCEAFNHILYCYENIEVSQEIHVRLGIAYKCLKDYEKSASHLRRVLEDTRETPLFTKAEIRYHIAHCYDAGGDLRRALDEYKQLTEDSAVQGDRKLLADVYRALGWVHFRLDYQTPQQRATRLAEAETYLTRARDIDNFYYRSHYYLGRVNSEIPEKASIAFGFYRSAIDQNEYDADTWCSIGLLYQFQTQDDDAFQAFICATLIDLQHSPAWNNLGKLYENHCQYPEALYCYKKALASHDPVHPDTLKKKIQVLYKGITENATAFLKPRPSNFKINPLPPLEQAWNLGIPIELQPHHKELAKLHKFLYRVGSPLWKMSELAASYSIRKPGDNVSVTQREIMNILKLNEDLLGNHELTLLRSLEERFGGPDPTIVMPKEQPRYAIQETTISDVKVPIGGLSGSSDVASGCENDPQMKKFPFIGSTASDPMDSFLGGDPSQPSTSNHHLGDYLDDSEVFPPKGGELPKNFSVLAPIHVPITVTASEIFDKCHRRLMDPDSYVPIFDEACPPPRPHIIPYKQRPQPDKLNVRTPLIKVEKPSEANSAELQTFCYKSPIALIRGLTGVLKMDLSVFSTKSLIETAQDFSVEVRTQYRMPGDINVDELGQPSWKCFSARSFTNVGRFGSYQAESFRHSLKEETERLRAAGTGSKYAIAAAQAAAAGTPLGTIATTAPAASLLSVSNQKSSVSQTASGRTSGPPQPKRKRTGGQAAVNASAAQLAAAAVLAGGPDDIPTGMMPMRVVKFGTNVDLSDEAKWQVQLRELNKMPAFCRIKATCNMLSHLGHTVLGMNTVQLYMKVPGCRTPGHLENNCFASVNINIGPGECEWFGVDYEYWPVVDKMCKDRGLDLMKDSWWPNFEDLVKARIPVYRFTQRAGDLVWVGGGCVHWVQSIGWCNNVAWNVGPMTGEQLEMSLYSHEWNKLTNYRSLVPMQHLCWQLAQIVRFSNQKMFNVVRAVLIRSLAYSRMIYDYVENRTKCPIKFHPRLKGEAAHYCHNCDIEVFNILFVKEQHNKFNVFCVSCAKKANFEYYVVLQQQNFEDLAAIFDRFQLHPTKTQLLC